MWEVVIVSASAVGHNLAAVEAHEPALPVAMKRAPANTQVKLLEAEIGLTLDQVGLKWHNRG